MSFAFSFSGDDIEDDAGAGTGPIPRHHPASAKSPLNAPAPAFPVPGRPLIPPTGHSLAALLRRIPSKIAYSILEVVLDDGSVIRLPRRELWDVRAQLMAEDDGDSEDLEGGGGADVRTGVYEGGFKSWESSVDLVKVLLDRGSGGGGAGDGLLPDEGAARVVELGCGTALPSLALFQHAMGRGRGGRPPPLSFVFADYNPTVLELVTLPNLVLAWALHHRGLLGEDPFALEGELELLPSVMDGFAAYLADGRIRLRFYSGGWGPEFAAMVRAGLGAEEDEEKEEEEGLGAGRLLILGAETIYSPFALGAFAETVFRLLEGEEASMRAEAVALVAAKKLYFGVGGSLDDFVDLARARGAAVTRLREETEGVRRGVVRCVSAC